MKDNLKIGHFEHWFQPPYKFTDFLKSEGLNIEKIDYSNPGYLEKYDVAIIEQNGFNDYIENDEGYIQDWVKRGGILMFMHQDYKRWAPYFLPSEVGYTQLIHRYFETINGYSCAAHPEFTNDKTPYMTYIMPWIEPEGKRLFSEPENIEADELLGWDIKVNSFGLIRFDKDNIPAERVRTSALSCYLPDEGWDIIGSFMDPAVRDGALILKHRYGKGMYFLNQLLFPEEITPEAESCISFWKKYIKNLISYFTRFKNGEPEAAEIISETLPIKENYKLTIHMHSLDWYGCDSAPGTINALMKKAGYDICAISVKDSAPYKGKLEPKKYSDGKVLFLDGQEYHPFNWKDKYDHLSHNTYHMLAIGTDPSAYTTEFTRNIYSDKEIDKYLKTAIDYIHKNNGVACATHPNVPYWYDYDFDAVDMEPMRTLAGTDIEKYWLSDRKIAVMNSVDLFGVRRLADNPAVNFIYLNGEAPSRESVVSAIKSGHTIATAGFDEVDIKLNGYLPGDTISSETALNGRIDISAKIKEGKICKLRIYSADKLIYENEFNSQNIELSITPENFTPEKFIRVEIEGEHPGRICNSTPFYIT